MSFQEAALFIGILLGSLSSSYIYRWTSPTILFAIAAFIALIAVLYTVFSIEESVQNTNITTGKMVHPIRIYMFILSLSSLSTLNILILETVWRLVWSDTGVRHVRNKLQATSKPRQSYHFPDYIRACGKHFCYGCVKSWTIPIT